MKRFAVAVVSLIDNPTLEVKVVQAPDWKAALEAAFPGYVENLSEDNLGKAQDEADEQDWQFDVVEI